MEIDFNLLFSLVFTLNKCKDILLDPDRVNFEEYLLRLSGYLSGVGTSSGG